MGGMMFALAQGMEPTSAHIRSLVVLQPSYQLIDDHALLLSVPESLKCNLQDVPQAAIEKAAWCTEQGLESIDVTEVLVSFAGTSLFATNSKLGDPMPGKPKLLVIRLTIRHLPDWYVERALGKHLKLPRLPTLLDQSVTVAAVQDFAPLISCQKI